MSYRCQVCRAKVPHRQKLLRHVAYRPDRSILGEVPVCPSCHAELAQGSTVAALIARLYPKAVAVVASAAPNPIKLF